jgi:hypothetical protein
MDEDTYDTYDAFDNDPVSLPAGDSRRSGERMTLALLEDLSAVLATHGYPPLRGYSLVEMTAGLYRIL